MSTDQVSLAKPSEANFPYLWLIPRPPLAAWTGLNQPGLLWSAQLVINIQQYHRDMVASLRPHPPTARLVSKPDTHPAMRGAMPPQTGGY